MSTTIARLAIAASATLNAGLLGVFAFAYLIGPAEQSRSATSIRAHGSASNRSADAIDARSPSNYLAHLRDRGLAVDETKPLLLSRLETEFLSGARAMFDERYWDAGMNDDYVKAEIELAKGQERVRAVLLELYGPDAQNDVAFQRIFRPLDPRLAVLSSAQQIAYQKYQLERRLEATANSRTRLRPAGNRPSGGPSAAVINHRSTVEALSRFLEPESVAEILFRYSALADQIRSADIDLTETEFREAFGLLEQLEGTPSPETYLETRDSLRRLLGADRFARVWAVRDPVYAALAAAGAELGLTEATTLAAYQIINDGQELMAEVVELQFIDPARARARMREAMAAQRERLSGLVGPEAAARLLRSLTIAAREITGQAIEGGRGPSGLPHGGQPTSLPREAP